MAFVGLWPDTHWVIEIEDYILCGHRTRVSGTRPSRTSPSPRDVCFQTRFSPPYPCYDMASAVGQIYSGGARARSLCSICRRERWKGESGAFSFNCFDSDDGGGDKRDFSHIITPSA